MSRQAYPKYKPSDIEWLGEVPEHWSTRPLKHVASFINGAAFKPSNWQDDGVPIIRIENLNGGEEFNFSGEQLPEKYHVKKDDLLFGWSGNRGTSFGPFLWWREGLCYLNQHIFRFAGYSCDKMWLYWTLKGVTSYVEKQAHGIIGMVHITKGDLGIIRTPVVPLTEQIAISSFLDRETARIDTLIEKKQRQIELLQEKRTALISHAVTKGLDPSVKMKDSGIEWLGKIPAHWEVKRLRYLGNCQNGINIGSEYFGKGHPFVSYSDVFNNRELPHDISGLVRSSAADRERYSVKAGDVFFTRTSETTEEIGFSSVCFNSIDGAVFAGFLIRFRPRRRGLCVAFSKYFFQSTFVREFLVKEMNLVTRASMSQDLLKHMSVLIPPLQEQARIALFLDRGSSRINSLIVKTEESFRLLREYRTALISAAVTGRIDVRDQEHLDRPEVNPN